VTFRAEKGRHGRFHRPPEIDRERRTRGWFATDVALPHRDPTDRAIAREPEPSAGALARATTLLFGETAGFTFGFRWDTFSGSYVVLSCASRS
jgi:hypothetical protein